MRKLYRVAGTLTALAAGMLFNFGIMHPPMEQGEAILVLVILVISILLNMFSD